MNSCAVISRINVICFPVYVWFPSGISQNVFNSGSSIDSVYSIFGHGRAVSLELVLDIRGIFLEIDDISDTSRIGYKGKSSPSHQSLGRQGA